VGLQAGVFQQGLFTAYLATRGLSSNGLDGGQITFGGLDTTNCGAVKGYAPLTAQSYWQFDINAVYAGSSWLSLTTTTAISDTGSSTIVGPSAVVAQIASAVGAVWNDSMGTYTVGCSAQYGPVWLYMNNVAYPLGPKALTTNYSPTGTGQCIFGIGNSGGNMWSSATRGSASTAPSTTWPTNASASPQPTGCGEWRRRAEV